MLKSFILILFGVATSLLGCGNTNKTATPMVTVEASTNDNTEKRSISAELKANGHLPIEEQVALYLKLKEENPTAYNFDNEDELTMYGYGFLWNNQTNAALEIFKLIASQFPNSSNAYDSLGEAYMKKGNMELSLKNYEKSLAMNPDNFNAEDQIERIKFPNKKPITPQEKFVKVYSVEDYKADLDQLGHKLIEINPNALKFISKEDFWAIINQKKSLITPQTTYGQFIWHCSEIIASINCSHTTLGGFWQESEMLKDVSLIFPLQTRWVNDKLYVVDAMSNSDMVKPKDELLSINGITVSKLVNDIYKHIESQGYTETTKKHFFNNWSTELIPYALSFPKTYTITIKGNENPIILNKAKDFKAPYRDNSITPCEANLCLEFYDDTATALMTISSFNYYPWNNLQEFKDFIDSSFKKIETRNIENLIIDLRLNGGGSAESSIYLLKHLVKAPFKYFVNSMHSSEHEIHQPVSNTFKGNLYFMIDGNGKSTTGHFMALAKELSLGTIVGEELGSNQLCTAGQTVCRLKNTKLQYYVANTASRVAVKTLPDTTGVLPDIAVIQPIEDYLNNIDTVKNHTLKLTETK
ncbi:S41 family peptidase [Gaetbulibacter sp. PBL-D1]|uniref:S41 family peptidase n=1 Tax=Gaetbulibacter sp. PBL-D1 TaxID=3422594 RepID=UPI003D2EA56E